MQLAGLIPAALRDRGLARARDLARKGGVDSDALDRSLHDVLTSMKMVAEGVRTTNAALALGERYEVELPIAVQVAELIAGRKDARTALYDLMVRPQRAEAG